MLKKIMIEFRIRARESEEHERSKQEMQRKMEMLLTLKNDILANRVSVINGQ